MLTGPVPPLAGFLGPGGSLLAAAFPLGVLGLSYVGAREIYRRITNQRRRVMASFFDTILAEVIACVDDRAVEGANGPKQLPEG